MTDSHPRLDSPAALCEMADSLRQARNPERPRCLICITGCRAFGALEVSRRLAEAIRAEGIEDRLDLVETGCHGFCGPAPTMAIEPHGHFYGGVSPDDVPAIIAAALRGQPVEELLYTPPGAAEPVLRVSEVPFFRAQRRTVLRNCGQIDPRKIEHSIERGGYQALARALEEMTPEQVIEAVSESGLRGRGGAGFPTGQKWSFARAAEQEEKYLICNAHGGDPGAFGDRALLEGDPHSVIEGMALAAYAIGAREGIVYLGPEYPLAEEHLTLALQRARELGLLGDSILGSQFSLDISVKKAGAFVSGEETGLIMALEGKRAAPRPRPPFPARSGLWEKPTNINNVETLANIPVIISNGPEDFASVGTATSKGTKVVTLTGKVRSSGLLEVPMGTTLREIVCDMGGGVPDGRELKGVQIGGPAGGCLPESALDLPLDYEAIQEAGAIMGSGGLVVMDDSNCTVDLTRLLMEFSQRESCGKCVPCRIGTRKMVDILERIAEGGGEADDPKELERVADVLRTASLCGLGQGAANPVLTALRYFGDEFEEHVEQRRCGAGVCEGLQAAET